MLRPVFCHSPRNQKDKTWALLTLRMK
jgi:hypothetical protein